MKKILFINPGPFGSFTDTYYYCKLLRWKYHITYVGFDGGQSTQKLDGIKIIHLPGKGNSIKQKAFFFKFLYRFTKKKNYDFVLINYFLGSSIISLFLKKSIIDIRTSYISSKKYKRILYNIILAIEVRFFNNVSAISENLAKYIHLPQKTHIIPLGAPYLPYIEKDFSSLKILYVGTFHQRDIEKTIYGFAKFISFINYSNIAHYTIVGHGSEIDINNINKAIVSSGMEKHVSYLGTIRHPEIIKYLNSHNVGISYIPIKKYFDNQPPTKTFEYLLSGMAVLATNTKENKKVMTDQCGVVVGDSVNDVYSGLIQIYHNRFLYNSENIQKAALKYSWEAIVKKKLEPYIEQFYSKKIQNNRRT